MRIDQRNAGASVTINNTSSYIVDRWFVQNGTSTNLTAQQSTDVPNGNFQNSIVISNTTAATATGSQQRILAQNIEGFNSASFGYGTSAAKTIVLSFWVKSTTSGTYGVAVENPSGANSFICQYSINSINTWEYKTIIVSPITTGSWGKTNSAGLGVYFDLGCPSAFEGTANIWNSGDYKRVSGNINLFNSANQSIYFTGVQLEEGTTATPFERRSYGQELALCQRYFETNYPVGYAVGSNSGLNGCWFSVSLNGGDFYCYGRLPFIVPKRADATLTIYNPVSGAGTYYDINLSAANGNVAVRNVGQYGASIYAATAYSANHGYAIRYTASAEL
jgi:hypothetical protein